MFHTPEVTKDMPVLFLSLKIGFQGISYVHIYHILCENGDGVGQGAEH